MDVAKKIYEKLRKILKKLKSLGIIEKYKLEINFCQVEENLKKSLHEIDSILRKCLKKIINKPRKAEIRNVISELVRKKNLNDMGIPQELKQSDLLGEEPSFHKTEIMNISAPLKFQCNFCEEIFSSKKNLITHKKSHKYSEKVLCDKCGTLFNNKHKWQEHTKECNEPTPMPFNLKYLPNNDNNELLFPNNSEFNILIENQVDNKIISENIFDSTPMEKELKCSERKPEGKEKFVCSCGKLFLVMKTLRKHERLKHSLKNKEYNCSTCGKSFIEKGKLNRHLLSHKESQYGCSFCSKQFSRSDTLKRHMSLFHYNSKEFFCRFCQKKFKLKFNRDIHEENTHKTISNQIQCQHCGGKFKSKVTLKSHLKIHFGNKITCTPCCKTFSRKSYYKRHIRSKHFGVTPCQDVVDGVSFEKPFDIHTN